MYISTHLPPSEPARVGAVAYFGQRTCSLKHPPDVCRRRVSGLLGSIVLSKLLETKNPGSTTRVFIYNFTIYN